MTNKTRPTWPKKKLKIKTKWKFKSGQTNKMLSPNCFKSSLSAKLYRSILRLKFWWTFWSVKFEILFRRVWTQVDEFESFFVKNKTVLSFYFWLWNNSWWWLFCDFFDNFVIWVYISSIRVITFIQQMEVLDIVCIDIFKNRGNINFLFSATWNSK